MTPLDLRRAWDRAARQAARADQRARLGEVLAVLFWLALAVSLVAIALDALPEVGR